MFLVHTDHINLLIEFNLSSLLYDIHYVMFNVCIGISVAVVSAGWWSGNIVSGEIAPFLLSSPLGTSGTLFLHAGLCGLVFVYILFLIPETKVCGRKVK